MSEMLTALSPFSQRLLTWYDQFGRHDLPWQHPKSIYRVWVSEVMLQQTQVKTVIVYFNQFMQCFPDVDTLANASWDEVAVRWAGLGYYARARNLHRAAQIIQCNGDFPQDFEGWLALPGIGRSTAGAILSISQNQYGVILDGNVKRVLTRHQAIAAAINLATTERLLWQLADDLTPVKRTGDYTQAIMDLGATLCLPKKTHCNLCPVHQDCKSFETTNMLSFPVRQKKIKKHPVRNAKVVIFDYDGDLFWQQRENNGIWGGLMSFPVIEAEDQWQEINALFDFTKQKVELKHQFTHFSWQLTVYRCQLTAETISDSKQFILQNFNAGVWVPLSVATQSLALPKAIEKICSALL